MSIIVDLVPTQPVSGKYHGGGEYGKKLFKSLIKVNNSKEIKVLIDEKKWIDPSIENIIKYEGVEVVEVGNYKNRGNVVTKINPNTFYSPLPYSFDEVDFSDINVIFTIHGLRPIEMPTDKYEYKYYNNFIDLSKYLLKQVFTSRYVDYKKEKFRRLVSVPSKNTTIVVPSMHTKYSLVDKIDGVDPEKIKVLYSPVTGKNIEKEDFETKKVNIDQNYILIVSGDRWIKNSYRAIEAIDELISCDKVDLKVMVTGVAEQNKIFDNIENTSNFEFLGYVERNTLERLYKEAFVLLYPSLNEGFGYPPLEAMRYGTPVICSAISSLTEICGEAPVYVNPYRRSEIRNRILLLVNETNIYDKISHKSKSHYEKVSKKQDEMLVDLCNIILAD